MAPEKPEEKPAKSPKPRRFFSPAFVDIFAGASSIAAAAGTMWSQIEKAAYANVSALWAFEGMKHDRHDKFRAGVKEPYVFEGLDKDERYRKIREAVLSNKPDIPEQDLLYYKREEEKALAEGLKHELSVGLVTEDKLAGLRDARQAVAKEERYAVTKGISGWNEKQGAFIMREVVGADTLWKRWGLMRGHQKVEALIFAAGVAGVALATILPATRANFSAQELDEIARKAADLNASKQDQPQR